MDRTWLSRTVEVALEPELEIVDPHHHLWSEPVGDRYPRYDLADLRDDTGAGHNVVATVFIDCSSNYYTDGPEHLRPVGETAWTATRADESDRTPGARIAAIVSYADLTLGEGVEEVLQAHVAAGGGRFRGIRHIGAWDADERIARSSRNPPPDLYAMPSFRTGMGVLGRLGMTFEAWQYHPQLPEVVDLARACPEVTIIVNHIGAPLGIGPYADRRDEVMAAWRPPMEQLAALPNTVLKVGGIGMTRYGMGLERNENPPTSDELLAVWGDTLSWCIEQWGPERCMFESNFPVDRMSLSYPVLYNALKKIAAPFSATERDAMFYGTASRIYRLD